MTEARWALLSAALSAALAAFILTAALSASGCATTACGGPEAYPDVHEQLSAEGKLSALE